MFDRFTCLRGQELFDRLYAWSVPCT